MQDGGLPHREGAPSPLIETSRTLIRPMIAVLVAPFLYAYVSQPGAFGWLAAILICELLAFRLRRLMMAGRLRRAWLLELNTVAVSLCWVTHAVLLWRVGGVIPSVAAVMGLFTVALYAAIGSYHSLKLFLCLVLPQLSALAILLISHLLAHATPLVAVTASLATLGACATILMNGVAMHLAEARLRQSNEELAHLAESALMANRAKSEFLATMSHEIRTPLNGVLGMVQAMARDDLPQQQRERLELIGASGETLLTILNDILDLSKIEAGKLVLEAAEFDLETMARGAQATFAHMVDGKGLTFRLEVEEAARGTWLGDSTRVRQVLYNLISNAVKFTESGSVEVCISRSEAGLTFRVADTGIGLSAEQIERLFEKFVQADSSTTRQFGGTGLGLSICRELCSAMGGDIRVESRLGQGSLFTALLPLMRTGEPTCEGAPEGPISGPELDGGRLRVLAAEDNRVNQLVLQALLGQAGVDLCIVSNGQEAVAAWEMADWDVILMDVQMPVMDGIAAAQAIRLRERETGRTETPIVALTANAMDHQVTACKAAGMTDFVAKPIEVSALFGALTRAVQPAAPSPVAATA